MVVDVQNDFADPAGSLAVQGATEVIGAVNEEIAAATAAGATVVYTQDWHPPRTPHFVTDGGPWPVHCVRDTWGAQLHPDLTVVGEAVRKGRGGEDGYSGFTMRDRRRATTPRPGSTTPARRTVSSASPSSGWPSTTASRRRRSTPSTLGYDCIVRRAATAPVEVAAGDGAAAEAELAAAGVAITA